MKQVESACDSPEGNTGQKGACSFQGVHDSAVAAAHDYDQTSIGIEDQCLVIGEIVLLGQLKIDEKLNTPCVILVTLAQYQCIQIVQTQTELLGVTQEQG